MEFRLSKHALDAMEERLIDEAMIAAVLAAPVLMPPTTRGTRYDGIVPDVRVLTVVVDENADPVMIVTAWWTQRGR